MSRPVSPLGDELRRLIARLSATKGGFAIPDAQHLQMSYSATTKQCTRMIKAGLLFRTAISGHRVRYHATQAASEAWIAMTPPRKAPRKQRPRKTARRVKAKAPSPVMPPAPPKPVKPVKLVAPKPIKSAYEIEFKRLPWMPKPLAKSAQIIYPERYRHSVRPFVDLRATSVPFLRIGQPGWAMRVGGAGMRGMPNGS